MHENDDIDLRPYLAAIARQWYWIVAITLIGAGLGYGVASLLPKKYTATTSIILFIRQTGSQISPNQPYVNIETIDIAARRQGLVALAASGAIEAALPAEAVQSIVTNGYYPGMFVTNGDIKAEPEGDLIRILARARSPQQAKALADLWADTYVNTVKQLYTDQNSDVQLVNKALAPITPSSPYVQGITALGGLGGALVGTVVALALGVRRTARVRRRQRVAERAANTSTVG